MAMTIIDSQVHIWAPETREKPYAKGDASTPHRPVLLGHEELLREMDAAGVHRCICVLLIWEGDRNDTSLEVVCLYLDCFAVMGRISINKFESCVLMSIWKNQPGMLKIR